MKETLINGKYKLILPDHRADRPEWATGWEVERIESMLSNLKKGDLVLDVGTEEGDISALLAQKTGNIIMFEPNEKVWPNIKAIWDANNLREPKAYFVGFASNKDKLGEHRPDFYGKRGEWPGCAYGELISNHGFKELYDAGNIRELKIDTGMQLIKEPVKLITIDVEGSEFEVLKGAEETLKKDKPLVYVSLHPEFYFRMFGVYTAEIFEFMRNLGYKYKILAFDHEFQVYWYHDQRN